MMDAALDPTLRLPLATGLLLAAVLPLLGVLLRLRDEWLAALGFAHLGTASGLAGLALGVPVVAGAPAGALLGAVVKGWSGGCDNSAYALMILGGWAAALLLAANTPLGTAIGHVLIDGQIYFAGGAHLASALTLTALSLALWPRIARRLVRARLFPHYDRANRLPAWRWHTTFDLLVALAMAVGTATVGLMGAFALVFVPGWIAFHVAGSWRSTLRVALAVGVGSYLAAFAGAYLLDQPFGPVLVLTLLGAALTRAWAEAGDGRRGEPHISEP